MTEAQARQKYVDTLRKWVGHKENDGSFRHIIDTYNYNEPRISDKKAVASKLTGW